MFSIVVRMRVSMRVCVDVICMRDELGEFHLIDELSQILNVWACIKLPLVSSVWVHNNCELPVGIYNICECLIWIGHRCSARCGVAICD